MKHADSSKRQDEYARNRAFRQGKSGVMNSDIRLSVGFWQHPKTKKTARRLGLEGIRSLQVLWAWAAVNRPNGDLSGMDWEDVELAADWQGEERKFFDTCLGMWIDESPDGYTLHDWQEHNPWASEADTRSDAARLSRFARKFPEIAKSMRDDGVKGLTQEEYRMYADGTPYIRRNTNVDTALNERSTDRSTPAPAPAPTLRKRNTPPPLKEGQGGSESAFAHGEEKPTPRELGTNPRAQGTNPRLTGDNPRAQGTNPRAQVETSYPDMAFVQFIDAYAPEKRDEGAAWQAWLTLSRAKQLPGLPKLLDAVTAWENSEQWQKDNGQYIPLASNFLSKRRFLDTPPQRADPADEFDPERFAKAAEQWKNRYKTTGGA